MKQLSYQQKSLQRQRQPTFRRVSSWNRFLRVLPRCQNRRMNPWRHQQLILSPYRSRNQKQTSSVPVFLLCCDCSCNAALQDNELRHRLRRYRIGSWPTRIAPYDFASVHLQNSTRNRNCRQVPYVSRYTSQHRHRLRLSA